MENQPEVQAEEPGDYSPVVTSTPFLSGKISLLPEVSAPLFVTLAPGTIASDYALAHLNKALGEAQNEFSDAVKGEENKWGGYKYAPLEALVKAVRPSLTKYHLTVSQFPATDLATKTVTLNTRIVHWDSGEWMQNMLEYPGELALGKDGAAKFNQQTISGSLTYAQKASYKTIVGITDGEELVDGGSSEDKPDLPARSKGDPKKGNYGPPKQSVADAVAQKSTPAASARMDAQEAQQQPAQAPSQAPTNLRSQFFGKAKELGWGLGEMKKYLVKTYGEASTAKLTEQQLTDTLEKFSKVKPEEWEKQSAEAAAQQEQPAA